MTCNEVEELLLEDRRACHEEEVGRHLKACPSCRSLSQELEDIEDLSYKLGRTEQAPEDFADCLLEKAASIRASRSKALNFIPLKSVTALAACLLVIVGALWVHQQSTQAMPSSLVQDEVTPAGWQEQGPGHGIRTLEHQIQPGYVDVYLQRPSQEPHIVRLPDTIQVRGRQVNYARVHSY